MHLSLIQLQHNSEDLDYKKDDFMALAKNYESILKPDQIIAIFEKLSSEIDEATSAYLHVLCEYEMIDKARESAYKKDHWLWHALHDVTCIMEKDAYKL